MYRKALVFFPASQGPKRNECVESLMTTTTSNVTVFVSLTATKSIIQPNTILMKCMACTAHHKEL